MMAKRWTAIIAVLLLMAVAFAATADSSTWKCPSCGRTGNTGNFCPNCGTSKPQDSSWTCQKCGTKNYSNFCTYCGASRSSGSQRSVYGLATQKLAINSGPGTKRYFEELGTYDVKGQYVEILARAHDPNNDIWWVKVQIPGKTVTGWTGLKRFDQSTFNINDVPIEVWY